MAISHTYIFHNKVENILYTRLGIKNPETKKFNGD